MADIKLSRPAKLGVEARKVWDEISGTYALRPDELRILEDACRQVDLVERLEKALDGADLIVKGSQGQPVANPLVAEIRQHRQVVKALLGSLKLPDEDGRAAESRSASARDAANARWRRGA